MRYKLQLCPIELHFKEPVITSRGVYTKRKSWLITLTTSKKGLWGAGECAPLPGLSCDDVPGYNDVLFNACRKLRDTGDINIDELRDYPSILFGLETALLHFNAKCYALWDTPFSRGEVGIPINGLVWMGDYQTMLRRIREKMTAGFNCIKLKIGAIDFEDELALLRHVRSIFSASDLELRVDANGAFSPAEAMSKLERLAELEVHSIEQPIRAGQWEEMAHLAACSPVPIALDEELIGCNTPEKKRELLKFIRPQYIVIKPSLHGGLCGGNEWIGEATRLNIDWWTTSALESNVGLHAIAQWCANFDNPLVQGLGTGNLFIDNVPMPLEIRNNRLWTHPLG